MFVLTFAKRCIYKFISSQQNKGFIPRQYICLLYTALQMFSCKWLKTKYLKLFSTKET